VIVAWRAVIGRLRELLVCGWGDAHAVLIGKRVAALLASWGNAGGGRFIWRFLVPMFGLYLFLGVRAVKRVAC